MQTKCDDDYLVVSKDKIGFDLMDSLFTDLASLYFIGL